MPTERKEERTEAERPEAEREIGDAERIEKRRSADRATEEREDDGWDQPESSAQKGVEPEQEP